MQSRVLPSQIRFMFRRPIGLFAAMACLTVLAASQGAETVPAKTEKPQIQVALLLDTSGSMSGLIDQARSQLWQMVNELVAARQNGVAPELQVALYEYGSSRLSQESGYIRQILPLTTNLDDVSTQLFSLKTGGGAEYCGQVIQRAARDLAWSGSTNDLKLIVIAGNEEFTQGPVRYQDACSEAISKGILVNTIHCGAGIPADWLDGAKLADGRAMNIDHNQAIAHIDAPQDKEIVRLSMELNNTYVAYGARGKEGALSQQTADSNASRLSQGSATQRAICKANLFYCNSEWDLVDAVREKKVDLAKLTPDELPENLRSLTLVERVAFIEKQQQQRAALQTQINTLNQERQKFVAQQSKQAAAANSQTLDQAFTKLVREQAAARKFVFERF